MNRSRILVTCPKAIPPILGGELRALGFPVVRERPAGVETEGTLDDCMKLNLWLRTGHRVLFLVREFSARDANQLYAELSRVPWEDHLAEDGYVCVNSSVQNPTIRDTRFASLKCKDAIVDRIRQAKGRRPDAGSSQERSVLFLHWRNNAAAVYFDTSGEPLSRRGYRKIPLKAPMQETLAAAVVLSTGWDGAKSFVNPMCGSGTLAIEAVLIGLGRAPGILRTNFGFMHLKGYVPEPWQSLRREAEAQAKSSIPARIIATDISPEAVAAAKQNAAAAGVGERIEFRACDFADTPVPEGGGVVVFNPEYGERLGDAKKLEPVYRRIGDFLKQRCRGCTGYVFTGNFDLANQIGLKPARTLTLFNSNIECRLLEFPAC